MKKLLFLVVAALSFGALRADTEIVNGIEYKFVHTSNSGTCLKGASLPGGLPLPRIPLVIPRTLGGHPVQKINDTVFKKTAISEVIIPEGCKEISYSVFMDCKNLERVVLPQSLERIGDFAFVGCSRLRFVEIPADSNLERIGRECFAECSRLSGFYFPPTLKYIGKNAFGQTAIVPPFAFQRP